MLGVVLVGELPGDVTQFQRDDREALGFEAADHGAGQTTADRIRLDQDEERWAGGAVAGELMAGTLSTAADGALALRRLRRVQSLAEHEGQQPEAGEQPRTKSIVGVRQPSANPTSWATSPPRNPPECGAAPPRSGPAECGTPQAEGQTERTSEIRIITGTASPNTTASKIRIASSTLRIGLRARW